MIAVILQCWESCQSRFKRLNQASTENLITHLGAKTDHVLQFKNLKKRKIWRNLIIKGQKYFTLTLNKQSCAKAIKRAESNSWLRKTRSMMTMKMMDRSLQEIISKGPRQKPRTRNKISRRLIAATKRFSTQVSKLITILVASRMKIWKLWTPTMNIMTEISPYLSKVIQRSTKECSATITQLWLRSSLQTSSTWSQRRPPQR